MRISVCQFAPGRDVPANLNSIAALARQASASGAELAVFPEAAMFQCMSPADKVGAVAQHLDGPFVRAMAEVACSTGVVLVVGMYERRAGGKPYNTVVAVGPDGLRAYHRKFLVYDAFGFRESDLVEVAAPRTDLFTVGDLLIGLITCYEVRFPRVRPQPGRRRGGPAVGVLRLADRSRQGGPFHHDGPRPGLGEHGLRGRLG